MLIDPIAFLFHHLLAKEAHTSHLKDFHRTPQEEFPQNT